MASPNTIYLVMIINIKLEEKVGFFKKLLNPKKLTVNVIDNSTQSHLQNFFVDLTAELIANYHINQKEVIFF
ncbi:hypothetical protein B6D12_01950 [Gilliamella apicola]|uniref:hypothetical protein n=1 Tax=Gilliamella TaxID=1193503 RepID=UPI0008109B88|nr:hypothetical protein [Gilliamella apicola]OCF91620.1 hypothetical protein A9G17_00040 [Gilliamella apicola]OTP89850.1 hypothetical protein B5S41_05630 [Gilliamella apicola]OTP94259.1 hypothetical protein B6D13_07740 [Gilliamella apicola]OTP95618.1 hypothetical protein B6D05_05840 [Gilliamella apicola]OTQ01937.1 hypothetical protein B6D07_07640 [Gilliamella apicola]